MSTERDTRLVLDTLDQPDEIPYLGIETTDFWAVAGPTAGGVVLLMLLDIGLLGAPLVALVFSIGVATVYAAPEYLTVLQWFRTLRYYATQPLEVNNVDAPGDTPTDSLAAALQADESTQSYTQVRRFYPELGAIERTDGHLVAAVELTPPNMDFATAADWQRVTAACEEWVNTSLEFDLQLYVTTRSFPIEAYTESLQERLADEDIRESPVLQAVIEETVDVRPRQLEQAGTEVPHFYLLVSVSPDELQSPQATDASALEKLASVPVVGIPFDLLTSYQQEISTHQRRAKLGSKLEQRVQKVTAGLAQSGLGYDSRRVSVTEWTTLLYHFWEGADPAFEDGLNPRSQPAVTGQSMGETNE